MYNYLIRLVRYISLVYLATTIIFNKTKQLLDVIKIPVNGLIETNVLTLMHNDNLGCHMSLNSLKLARSYCTAQ